MCRGVNAAGVARVATPGPQYFDKCFIFFPSAELLNTGSRCHFHLHCAQSTAPRFSRLRRSTCAPPNVPVALTPMVMSIRHVLASLTYNNDFTNDNEWSRVTRSAATADGPRDAILHSKSCQLLRSVREYVFFVFFRFQKNMTLRFFEMTYQKVVKSHQQKFSHY